MSKALPLNDDTADRAVSGYAAYPKRVSVDFDVPARMRDGTILRANVYRPEGEGPWPTLLTRLPYGKDGNWEIASWVDPLQAARRGFMVVVQDTRGRFASDGEWLPFRFERDDGFDSVEWAARLPGSNGRVGMYGASYFGNTQWMAAVERPPSLAAIVPAFTWSEPLDGLLARGGALELGLTLPWSLQTAAGHLARRFAPSGELDQRLDALFDDYDHLASAGYWELPVIDNEVVRRHGVPDLGTFAMLSDADVPAACRVTGQHERVSVPTFHIGGWYDLFLQGTLDNFMAMSDTGRPARLVVGPWLHELSLSDPIGHLCFGIRSSGLGVPAHDHRDLNDLQLVWFERHLRPDLAQGSESAATSESPVRIFVMGRNEWRDESSWPLDRARSERWFLGAGGSLRPGTPDADRSATGFTYDPADPVPTIGGNIEMVPAFPRGACDQGSVEKRHDVCVFTSEPLREDTEVTGRVRVVLRVQSTAPSTDWVARLCDVHPDGKSFNLCDGIVRIDQGANALREVEIDLWSTSNVFLTGHRLRLHVTSSSFPRWDRNLNTGNQMSGRFQIAHQRIFHDVDHPSWVELPVIPS